MAELTQRVASLNDLPALWGLLRDAAGDIPFQMEGEQESVLSELMACCTSGLSPLVVNEGKDIVGALLVRRDDFEWCFLNSGTIHVAYAALSPANKDQEILKSLLSSLKEQNVPVLVSVKTGNQLGLSDMLAGLGFEHEVTSAAGWGDLYRWTPPKAN